MEASITSKLAFTNRVMEDRVYMLVDKGIGPASDDPNVAFIDGGRFAEELYYWKAQGKKCIIKINSPGGRVTHGWSMIDAIIETEAETENVGIAYSMGGICLLFGSKRRAYDFASCMIHAPFNPNAPENSYTKVVKAQFRNLLETRTKFTADEINDMMDSGKDYFFNAKEMLKKGIIDEIITTNKSIKVPASASTVELHEFFNKALITDSKLNSPKMENLFAKIFKKSNDDEAVVAAMEMKAENESLKTKNESLEAKVIALEKKISDVEAASAASEAKTKATALIEGAIAAKKFGNISAEDKAKLIDNAASNYEVVKMMIDGMPAQAEAPKKTKAAVAIVSEEKGATAKTYEWLAKNDPAQLNNIAENDPELFQKLQDEYVAKMKGESE